MGEYVNAENEDLTVDQDSDSHLVRDLRHQLRTAKQTIQTVTAERDELQVTTRAATISKVLGEHGVKDEKKQAKVAKLIEAAKVEATEKAIGKWLEEFGDVFGISAEPAEPASQSEPAGNAPVDEAPAPSVIPPEVQALLAALAATEQAGTASAPLGADAFRQELSGLKGKGFDAVMEALNGRTITA